MLFCVESNVMQKLVSSCFPLNYKNTKKRLMKQISAEKIDRTFVYNTWYESVFSGALVKYGEGVACIFVAIF